VAQILKVAELAYPDGVAQVDVGRRGVEALLDPEGLSGLER